MVYKGSMISDFFVKWFKESSVPSLDKPHLIVMDNASFHPKRKLDQLSISNGHIFLPFPPTHAKTQNEQRQNYGFLINISHSSSLQNSEIKSNFH